MPSFNNNRNGHHIKNIKTLNMTEVGTIYVSNTAM